MTADAFVTDWPSRCDHSDPDATWVDLLRGQRGRTLPEPKTACLPAAETQCLAMSEVARAPHPVGAPVRAPVRASVGPLPSAHTCLGQMVGPGEAPRDDLATVFEFKEGLLEQVQDGVPAMPAAVPAVVVTPPPPGAVRSAQLSSPWVASQGHEARPARAPKPPRTGTPAGAGAPQSPPPPEPPRTAKPRSRAAGPELPDELARAATYLKGEPAPSLTPPPRHPSVDLGAQAALHTPCAPHTVRPQVPTWAGAVTHMEGPGVWMEPGDRAVGDRAGADCAAPPRQRYLPTMIAAVPPSPTVQVRRTSVMDQALPFTLVLIAISLATAALVGAFV